MCVCVRACVRACVRVCVRVCMYVCVCWPNQAYYSDGTPGRKLFEVFLQQPSLAVLSDPSMLGRDCLLQQMQNIDHHAPLPADISFSTLWGCYTTGKASQFQVCVWC